MSQDLRHILQKGYSKCSAFWLAGKTPVEEKVVPLWLGVMPGLAPVYSGHSEGLRSSLFPGSSCHAGSWGPDQIQDDNSDRWSILHVASTACKCVRLLTL